MNYIYYAVVSEEGIQHHGVKGMHWGIRLFQYKDGTLTPLGKLRYGKNSPERIKSDEIIRARKEAARKEVAEAQEKKRKEEELRRTNEFEYKKERLINAGNATEIQKYKDLFTTQELAAATNRIDVLAKLESQSKREREATFMKINSTVDKLGKINNWVQTGLTSAKNVNNVKEFVKALNKKVEEADKKKAS